ncbi:hypothetical protein IJ707_05140 [bacterium]|nr:hypothetical protein [bacterium]
MINIIDTFRNIVGDKYAMVKIFILTVPTVISVYANLSGQAAFANTVNIAFGVVFAAIFFETIRRSCNAEPMLLPSFMLPFRMFITLGLTILAAIPVTAVCVGLGTVYFYVMFNYFPDIVQSRITMQICSFILSLLISSLFFASVTQFLDTGKVWDSYNPIKVTLALKTFIVNNFLFVIQDMIFNLIVLLMPAYIIMVLAGMDLQNFFVILWLSMGGVINYLMFADYMGQTKKESELY